MLFNSTKDINRLRKKISRLLSKEMSNIYLKSDSHLPKIFVIICFNDSPSKMIKSILIHECQHKSTRINTNQKESTRVQHESTRAQHESDASQHESTRVQHASDTSQHEPTRINTSQHESTRVQHELIRPRNYHSLS